MLATQRANFFSAPAGVGERLCESIKGWNDAKQLRDYAGILPKLSIRTR